MKVDTKFGEVDFKNVIFDIDGKNLEEGVEIRIDGELELEIYGFNEEHFESIGIEEIEEFLTNNGIR